MSKKIQEWIEMAKAKGLVVEVEEQDGRCYESISVRIEMEKVEGNNMLALIYNSQMLAIHGIKVQGGKWKHSARFYEMFSDVRELNLKSVKYRIEGMAESHDHYDQIQGAKA